MDSRRGRRAPAWWTDARPSGPLLTRGDLVRVTLLSLCGPTSDGFLRGRPGLPNRDCAAASGSAWFIGHPEGDEYSGGAPGRSTGAELPARASLQSSPWQVVRGHGLGRSHTGSTGRLRHSGPMILGRTRRTDRTGRRAARRGHELRQAKVAHRWCLGAHRPKGGPSQSRRPHSDPRPPRGPVETASGPCFRSLTLRPPTLLER